MAVNLSIKNVPEELAERLRARAERNHRSLQGELMAIVSAAVGGPERPPARAAGAPWATPESGTRTGWMTTEEVWAELQRRNPEGVVRGGPLGVDIVRADRDAR